ncbi:MAG: D-serine ammonia-lyase [Candidatus Ornithomonoglobus sp.]
MESLIINNIIKELPVLQHLKNAKETVWINPNKVSFKDSMENIELSQKDIDDAGARLARFAPLIMKFFPETKENNGLIESPLKEIKSMQQYINKKYNSGLKGRLLLKEDSHLAIAGSVKARGGIYEVLKYTEDLAVKNGLITVDDDYSRLADKKNRDFFGEYTIQVGSTGNLGLSIGIMSAVIGYHVIVHMSSDAKQWKKELLRSYGVDVKEYDGDYCEAVKQGRALSERDPKSYFVDDENSVNLFLGYSVAGKRLKKQLDGMGIVIDSEHPLFVYIPCGVGGAPGGISFGLKQIFKDNVHCFFAEPVQAPCMTLGMATGLNEKISVQDIGLSGQTHADGLAVGRPSSIVGRIMRGMLSGSVTVEDSKLYDYMRDLMSSENIFLEPSACAAFWQPVNMNNRQEIKDYIKNNKLEDKMSSSYHIVWATGGSFVPSHIIEEYMKTFL